MIGRLFGRGRVDASGHVIDFYEKPGCHLCEDALAVVEAEASRAGAELRRHNILEDKDLQRKYGELIPVVVIDGEQHSTWFVQEARLRQALR
ncbi:glutaredoxin family protein [Gulosibacter chungangensis]|uniref:glutaredoxin family protein n=1 Tax=Gulosibacter chungangensis TaxID=979746 RepID=UPI001CE3C2EE|nr:glutaredoxin family protein [Gulosibacter chungangensis]